MTTTERPDRAGTLQLARRALEAALHESVRGGVRLDGGTRAVYATDSSNYRQVPIGVVFPLDHDDVVATMRVCGEHDAPVLARGAGNKPGWSSLQQGGDPRHEPIH